MLSGATCLLQNDNSCQEGLGYYYTGLTRVQCLYTVEIYWTDCSRERRLVARPDEVIECMCYNSISVDYVYPYGVDGFWILGGVFSVVLIVHCFSVIMFDKHINQWR